MKNKTLLKLFIIILAGLFFRIWLLDKPEGLWFDEYVSWYTAAKNNLSEFLTLVFRNCHMPLYYIYLKLWLLIFPDTDLSLRWSSVLPSVASIPLMYLLGKELFNNKNTGLLCALFTAVSSFLIYFAQEVRLYSIIFLVSAAIALYFVRSVRNPSKGNFILFLFYNFILCALHTLGIIFSFFIIISLLTYLYRYNNQCKDKILPIYKFIEYIFPFLLVMLILSPFLISIAFSKNLSQFWSDFSYTKILCVFVDYFSPIQTNIINTPESFLTYIHTKK